MMNSSYYSLSFLKEGWIEGRFSFVTSIIFMINRMVLRGLFLDGLAWWNPLKGYPVFTNFLGVLFLLCLSLLLASLIVSNGIVNIKLSKLHAGLFMFSAATSAIFIRAMCYFFHDMCYHYLFLRL